MPDILIWWLLIQILGLAALPLAYWLFKWLPGRGYAFAKPLGLLLTSYILWLGASLGLLKNTVGGILAAIALTIFISLWLYFRHGSDADWSLLTFLRERRRLILAVEVVFTAAFLAWALLRAYVPDKIMSSGGEKFMEIAFLNAILRSPQFPPHDPWLSGFAISYYYLGYVMMALLTRLSGAAPGVGFDLYDALLFALTVTGAFGVVYNLVAGSKCTSSNSRRPLWYGLLGSLFVAVMGNLEGFLEVVYAKGVLPMGFWDWLDIPGLIEGGHVTGSWYPGQGWWWWRASRVIRDRDLLGEPILSPIDEFPFFSFLLGDNHPHVLALPFALMAVALALNLLRRQFVVNVDGENQVAWWNPVAYCLHGDWARFVAYALTLGALGFLNTWDFPIYLAFTVLAYGVGRYAVERRTIEDLLGRLVVLGGGLLAAGVLAYFPFYVSFRSQAAGVLPYLLTPTRLSQYLVMFGPFVFIIVWFLIARLLKEVKRENLGALLGSIARGWVAGMLIPVVLLTLVMVVALLSPQGRQFVQGVLANPQVQQAVGSESPVAVLKAILLARLRDPWLFLTLPLLMALAVVNLLQPTKVWSEADRLSVGALFASLLTFFGLLLTFSVEFVYLRDNFGVRMNTVFKFYYQAWVMLGCASAYGVWWMLSREALGSLVRPLFLVGVVFLSAAGIVYPLVASYSRAGGFRHEPNLNGAINVSRSHPDDWAAIEWLRANARDTPVILEAPGESYDYEGRISAFTGFPTVLGWALHESQWRGNYVEQGKREPDIATIYSTSDGEEALRLIHKWRVDYVVVGLPERRYVEDLCGESDRQCNQVEALQKFDRLLEPVFKQGQTTIYRVPGT